MPKRRNPTAADRRRLERLLWGPKGIYADYQRERWEGSIASFESNRTHQFSALGQSWTLDFGASLFSRWLELGITLSPDRPLSERNTQRLQKTGFYDDIAAWMMLMGYHPLGVQRRGGMWCRRLIAGCSEIAPAQDQFERLDLQGFSGVATSARPDRQRNFRDLLRWVRLRRAGWRTGSVEFRISSTEIAAGVRWKTRRDLLVGPSQSCSWFFAWPPKNFTRAAWRRLEKRGFFDDASRELKALRQEGSWRPNLFRDPDRLAAEFWKPTVDPGVTRKDFEALLAWRLPAPSP